MHYWVFGGPWTDESEPTGEPTGEDAAWLQEATSRVGAVVGGRWTFEAAGHWGDENSWAAGLHRHAPARGRAQSGAFTFVSGVEAVDRAKEAAGGKDVHVMGGGGVRQSPFATFIDYRVKQP